MATWHLAGALAGLLAEVNARWPGRSTAVDGTIGDASHQARISDHNPDANGQVNAVDITVDPTGGPSGYDLVHQIVGDPRLAYVIFNRTIWSKAHGWAARPYTGPDPHTNHVHISLDPVAGGETDNAGNPIAPRASSNTTPIGSSSSTSATPAGIKIPTPGGIVGGLVGGQVDKLLKGTGRLVVMGTVLVGGTVLIVLGVTRGVKPAVDKVVQLGQPG